MWLPASLRRRMHPQKTDISRLQAQPLSQNDPASRFSLLSLVNTILRDRWMIICAGMLTAVVVVVITLRQPRSYTASASFMPQAPSNRGSVGGIASQLGISFGEAGSTDSPEFYADLLTSRSILGDVVNDSYTLAGAVDSTRSTFMNAVGIAPDSPGLMELNAIKYLRKHMSASTTPKLGTVVVSVSTPSAALSHQVVQRMLDLVSNFNQTTRRSQAAAEREFIARRLSDIRDDLHVAEERLQSFLVRNRQYQSSPPLMFEHDRLTREVALQQQLFTTISDAYERASIEAVRDTPVITVIEQPEAPLLPDRRMLPIKAAVALLVGMLIGVAVTLARQVGTITSGSSPDEYAEFQRLRKEAFHDLLAPWRPLSRWRAGRRAAG